MRLFLIATLLLCTLTLFPATSDAQPQAAPVRANYFIRAKALCNPGALATIAHKPISFEDFRNNGTIAGISFGDDMNKAVAAWGLPQSISCGHDGTRWWHEYRNLSVEYQYGRIRSVSLRSSENAHFAFDNGLSSKSTSAQVIQTLGQPWIQRMGSIDYKQGSRQSPLCFTFTINGQFPQTPQEWQQATLSSISLSTPILKTPAGTPVPNEGYYAQLTALIAPGAQAPLEGKKLDYAQFLQQGVAAGITLDDSMAQVVALWGKPDRIASSSLTPSYWSLGYQNATLTFNDNKLAQITLGDSVRKSDFAFDNGLLPALTIPQTQAILGVPRAHPHQYGSSSGIYLVQLHFLDASNQRLSRDLPPHTLCAISVTGPMQ